METITCLKKLLTRWRRTDRPHQPSVREIREQIYQAVLADWPKGAPPPARTIRELAMRIECSGGNHVR